MEPQVSHPPQRDYWPTQDWREAPPEAHGLDPAVLAAMDAYARTSSPPIAALLVTRHGYVVFEGYYAGFDRASYFNVYSITKSVVSALVGRALQRRLIVSLDQRLLDVFPEYDRASLDPRARAVALRHLLSMTSGFDPAATNLEILWRADDVVKAALERPMAHAPGASFFYDDVSIHLLSILLARVSGLSTAAFADAELFRALGIWTDGRARFVWRDADNRHNLSQSGRWPADGLPWTVDGHGHNAGGFGLHLTAREMAKLGYLHLNGGWWGGAQLLSPAYVAASTRSQSPGGPPVGRPYGYGWWIPEPHPAFFATGLGGQTIHVVPGLDLVTVLTTCSDANEGAQRGRIVEGFVLPAIRPR
jgi:CubicO group peptidase (beta-lactamase class C family)